MPLYSAACLAAPPHPRSRTFPPGASARRSHACDTRRCNPSSAASSSPRSAGSSDVSMTPCCSGRRQRKRCFAGDENRLARNLSNRLPKDLLGIALRVHIRSIEKLTPASRHTSIRRVASSTSVSPHARKNSFPPSNVPVPRQRAGTVSPLFPDGLNSMEIRCAAIRIWSPRLL